jgi:hypothetical protein
VASRLCGRIEVTRRPQCSTVRRSRRAGAAGTLDVERDDADLGHAKIKAPLMALWSRVGPVEKWYDPLEVWREWADQVEGRAVGGGHFMPEKALEEIVSEVLRFLGPLTMRT